MLPGLHLEAREAAAALEGAGHEVLQGQGKGEGKMWTRVQHMLGTPGIKACKNITQSSLAFDIN